MIGVEVQSSGVFLAGGSQFPRSLVSRGRFLTCRI